MLYVHDLILDKYFFLNNSLEQRLGYKKKSFNPMSKKMLSDLMHPDDFLQYDAFIHQVSKSTSRKFFESEYRLKTNTGNWRWFLSKETVYQRDSNNNVSKIFGIATEVTSMKSAELKSKESRANLNALIESTSDIIYSIDNEFRIITMNSECRRNFSSNSGVEYYEGLNILTGLEEIRVKYFSDLFKRVLMGERVNYNYEYHVEGRIKDLEVTLNPVFNDDGIVISITCFAKDVTNYKTATKIIKEQNILLNSIIESTSSSVFAFDTEGRYIAFNALHKNTMKKIYDVDIKLGMNWTELLSEGADYEKSIRNWERGLAGESFTIVTEYGLGLPERPIYELSYTPIKDENETITGISIYSKDITKKVKDQELLLATERKFRDVFENSPDAIFVEDFAGNIIDVNPAGIVLQDLSKEKLIGLNIRNLVPKEKYVKILRDYKQLYFGVIKTLESSVW